MSIDITREQIISLRDAAATLPRRPHIATVYRWMTRGVRGRRLETILIGGRRYTSREAITRFVRALSVRTPGSHTTTDTSGLRRAESELEQEGI